MFWRSISTRLPFLGMISIPRVLERAHLVNRRIKPFSPCSATVENAFHVSLVPLNSSKISSSIQSAGFDQRRG